MTSDRTLDQSPDRFNPHRLFPAGATYTNFTAELSHDNVSILTGCFQPVQRPRPSPLHFFSAKRFNPHRLFPAGATPYASLAAAAISGVSILTGCFQPVQPARSIGGQYVVMEFQSSPAVSSRCNERVSLILASFRVFQSSPAVSSRCNDIIPKLRDYILIKFQSSPAVSSRCN